MHSNEDPTQPKIKYINDIKKLSPLLDTNCLSSGSLKADFEMEICLQEVYWATKNNTCKDMKETT